MMEHMALYRRYRPMTFDEIVEQDHAVSALRQSVRSGKVGHAYLFSGTRGTGKTSIAKVFARAINCLSPNDANPCNQCTICKGILDSSLLDVIEMDAASNNSVDHIRRICDEVLFLPSQAKYKVYIVDEVHMLSTGAFNALLKTLEEPPEHAVFILATTEPHRIPATIISRCQRYDFRRIPSDSIVERLSAIANSSKISIEHDALIAIASLSDGALRDAISLLDQIGTGASKTITSSDVYAMVGLADRTVLLNVAQAILSADVGELLSLCDQLILDGRDLLRFTLDLAHFFRDLTVISVSGAPKKLLRSGISDIDAMKHLANTTGTKSLIDIISALSELTGEMKWSPDMRTTFEIALVSISNQFISNDGSKPSESFENTLPSVKQSNIVSHKETINLPQEPIESKASSRPKVTPAPPSTSPKTSNVIRAAESKRSESNYKTNLSTLVSSSNVRTPNIPLPPTIPDEDIFSPPPPAEPVAHSSAQTTSESSNLIIQKQWTDVLDYIEKSYSDLAMLLRHAKIFINGDTLRAILPEKMNSKVHQLTQTNDYMKMTEDIIHRLDTIEHFEIITHANDMDSFDSSKDVELDRPEQPEWIQRMLDFAKNNNIPIESTDH